MGAACCVAVKSRTITVGTPGETMQRHSPYSRSWNFRRDNRGRVAGEETSSNCFHDVRDGNNRVNAKSSTPVVNAFDSIEGSPIDSFQTRAWHKSSVSAGNSEILRLPSYDQAISLNLAEVKESPFVPRASPVKPSPAPSVSSLSTSPLSSQSHPVPPSLTTSRLHHRSPGHRLLRQVSDSRIPGNKSPAFSISEEAYSFLPLTWGNDSTRGSIGGSSDGWSMPASSDIMTNQKERWSFDSEASGFSWNKISFGHSGSSSLDLQTCGVCMKLLCERSSLRWSSHTSSNELAVVSVLTCGHVYHAECLENMTPEISKYDPDCPICILGEKRVIKMSGKALKAELDSKARKRSRKRVADRDINSNFVFDDKKSSVVEGRSPIMSSSLSMKSARGKPLLRRHFSFGFKAASSSENQSTRRKVFSWGRSSKD